MFPPPQWNKLLFKGFIRAHSKQGLHARGVRFTSRELAAGGHLMRATMCKRGYTQLRVLPHSPQELCLDWPIPFLWSCYSPCSGGSSPCSGGSEFNLKTNHGRINEHTPPGSVLCVKCFMTSCIWSCSSFCMELPFYTTFQDFSKSGWKLSRVFAQHPGQQAMTLDSRLHGRSESLSRCTIPGTK